jgi:hypothetical protein
VSSSVTVPGQVLVTTGVGQAEILLGSGGRVRVALRSPWGEDHCEAVLPGEELLLLAFAAEYRPTSLLKQRVELADVGVT